MRHLAAVAFVAAASAVASANGRPPATNGIAFRPGTPSESFVRTTFGLLISKDDGCSFRWICEDAIGYGGTYDPKYAVAADGTIYATTFEGLRISRDSGCTWVTAASPVNNLWIDALEIASNGDVWVATAESGAPNDIYRSTDGGQTFTPRGMQSASIWWKSVKAAQTNAQLVYVAGYQVSGPSQPDASPPPPTAHFLRTENGGDTWTESTLAGVQFAATPIILIGAVDPVTPTTVLLISVGANIPSGDKLYRSTDGGESFTEVLATQESIRDVVFHAGKVYVATQGGSFESADGITYGPFAGAPQLGCLGENNGTLVGCGANWGPDFKAVAVQGPDSTWTKQFRFVELAGPLECPAGSTVETLCNPLWPALKEQFGAKGPTDPACALPPEVDGPDVVGAEPPTVKGPGGCCDAGGTAPFGAMGLTGLAIMVGFRRRTSRRR